MLDIKAKNEIIYQILKDTIISGKYNIKTINEFGHFYFYLEGRSSDFTSEELKECIYIYYYFRLCNWR